PGIPSGCQKHDLIRPSLVAHGDGFRFRNPVTGELLLDHAETATALRVSETARRQAESARRVAEARVAELEALLRRSDHP
ncbi:MAG: hypothetical protein OXL38_15315, partial [Gammaproteobacteria bacterium]|nr:hypothetical protein [Gammaproteobacteria bacterium]